MQKYVRWYLLLLKARMKRTESWLVLIGMTILILLIAKLALPTNTNTKVLVYCKNEQVQNRISDILEKKDSIFRFETASDEEELKQKVVSGYAECGFVIDESLEEKIAGMQQNGTVTYYCSSLSTKGEIAKETLYSALLEIENEILLRENISEIYRKADENTVLELLDRQREYLDSDRIFRLYEVTAGESGKEEEPEQKTTLPVHGTIGIFVFLLVFFAVAEEERTKNASFSMYLEQRERFRFSVIRCLGAVTPEVAAGLALLLSLGLFRNVFPELAGMVCLFGYSYLWCKGVRRLLRKDSRYMGWSVAILLVTICLCPVYIDTAVYFPVVSKLRYLLPVGLYLKILG